MKVRHAHVAGAFYPGSAEAINSFMHEAIDHACEKREAKAVMMPHAGYVYSGRTAALTISQVFVTDTVLLLGPNHTGIGAPFSIMTEGAWRTPLGDVPIDGALAKDLCVSSPFVEENADAHLGEHSLEVEVPFLQYQHPGVSIVPLTIGTHDLSALQAVGDAIATVLQGRRVLIVISSDMTHFESEQSAQAKDAEALEAVCNLDEGALAQAVMKRNISMCGFAPAYCALVAVKQLGADHAELVQYCTSADVTGDATSVVGYAGVVIT